MKLDFLDFSRGVDVSTAFKYFEMSKEEVMIIINSYNQTETKYYKAFINKNEIGYFALIPDKIETIETQFA